MDIPRKLGVLIFTAVPAIVGGGIVYHFFGSFTQVLTPGISYIKGKAAPVQKTFCMMRLYLIL